MLPIVKTIHINIFICIFIRSEKIKNPITSRYHLYQNVIGLISYNDLIIWSYTLARRWILIQAAFFIFSGLLTKLRKV